MQAIEKQTGGLRNLFKIRARTSRPEKKFCDIGIHREEKGDIVKKTKKKVLQFINFTKFLKINETF